MKYWIVKSPFRTRTWNDVLTSGVFQLYGIRNHQARKNISKMGKGDLALFYSSAEGRKILGIMRVASSPFGDPTSESNKWLAVKFKPFKTFEKPVSRSDIKEHSSLFQIRLIKQPRLSVVQISAKEFQLIESLSNNK